MWSSSSLASSAQNKLENSYKSSFLNVNNKKINKNKTQMYFLFLLFFKRLEQQYIHEGIFFKNFIIPNIFLSEFNNLMRID